MTLDAGETVQNIKKETIAMEKVITRFAPSPTGMLHIGNARAALINWLYASKHNGQFILRIDDTDTQRSSEEYKNAIEADLKWLGLTWDLSFNQLSRLDRYEGVKAELIAKGRLYPCFESTEELEMKRKLQLSSGKPPIYDRYSLKLKAEQIDNYLKQGRTPHYRFLLEDGTITWQDMIKGEVKYQAQHLSDPIVIRGDGNMTYMLCSVIDDIDYNITHIIRGEDHVTNTALQIQMFEALSKSLPTLGHLSLVKVANEKISKRAGGFEIANFRDEMGYEAMAINSFFALIGSSQSVVPYKNLAELAKDFDIANFSSSPTTYLPEDLERLNHKLLINSSFAEVQERIKEICPEAANEQFWLAVRPNLQKLVEIKDWWKICHSPEKVSGLDKEFLKTAAAALPMGEITTETWGTWTKLIGAQTGKKGRELFMPLRLSLTGAEHGPELKNLLPLISREEILKRLGE